MAIAHVYVGAETEELFLKLLLFIVSLICLHVNGHGSLVRGDHGKQCLEPSTSHPWLHIYLTINIRNLTKLSLGTISILLAFILAVIP